jgi:hypothetical protein
MAKKEYWWNIFLLRATPTTAIGSVEVSNPASAIKKAIEVFEITDLSHLFQVPLPVHNTGLRGTKTSLIDP